MLFTSRAPIGYCVVAANPIATNQGFKSLVLHGRVNAFFVRHYLISAKAYAEQQASGSTFLELSGSKMKRLLLPLPPKTEQRRIASKIDALQARSAAARAALQAIPPLLDRFRQSVLAAAFRGDLTRDWRAQNPDAEPASALLERIRAERRRRWIEDYAEKARARAEKRAVKKGQPWTAEDDAKALEKGRKRGRGRYEAPEPADAGGLPLIPKGWTWARFDELLVSLRSGTTQRASQVPSEFKVLRSSAVRYGAIDFEDTSYLARVDKEPAANRLATGDLLFTRLSGTLDYVANCAEVQALPAEPIWYPDRLIRARTVGSVVKPLVVFAFEAKTLRGALEQRAKSSAGHQRISLGDLRDFVLPLPPYDEQAVISRRLAELLDGLPIDLGATGSLLDHLDRLDQSILAKAFRGELVPQDPDDEPASALLERIRAEREAAAPKKKRRGRKPRKPKPAPTPAAEPQPKLPGLTPDG